MSTPPDPWPDLEDVHVFVIDDNDDSRRLLQQVLTVARPYAALPEIAETKIPTLHIQSSGRFGRSNINATAPSLSATDSRHAASPSAQNTWPARRRAVSYSRGRIQMKPLSDDLECTPGVRHISASRSNLALEQHGAACGVIVDGVVVCHLCAAPTIGSASTFRPIRYLQVAASVRPNVGKPQPALLRLVATSTASPMRLNNAALLLRGCLKIMAGARRCLAKKRRGNGAAGHVIGAGALPPARSSPCPHTGAWRSSGARCRAAA
jgi:hypothetical protein